MSPTLLLIHGGGHGNPAYLKNFQKYLNSEGLGWKTYRAPSETSPYVPGRVMYKDAEFWREKIVALADAGEDIVIFAHSIGSVVATEAAKGLTRAERQKDGLAGGVVHFIFLAAYLAVEGDSVFSFYEKYPLPTRAEFDAEKGVADLAPFKEHFYNDLPIEERDHWASFLVTVPIEWYTQPVTQTTWKDVPLSWIYTELDEIVTYDVQKKMVKEAQESQGVTIKTYTLNSGHSPFLSMPEKLTAVVKEIYVENKL